MPRPPSLRGAIQFNDIIWSRGTCFILASLCEVVLTKAKVIHEMILYMPQHSPSFVLHCLPSISEIQIPYAREADP